MCGHGTRLCHGRASRSPWGTRPVRAGSSLGSWKCHMGRKKVKNEVKGTNESLLHDPGTHFAKAVLDGDITAPTVAVRKG